MNNGRQVQPGLHFGLAAGEGSVASRCDQPIAHHFSAEEITA